jgi:hypothetical protein
MYPHLRYAAILAEPVENAWMGLVYLDKTSECACLMQAICALLQLQTTAFDPAIFSQRAIH